MLKRLRARLGLPPSQAEYEESVERAVVGHFIADYRRLCTDAGPWQMAADAGAPPDCWDLRQIAYLAVWAHGPTLSVWEWVRRYDAVDLVIDAAIDGFTDHLATVEA